MRKKAYIDSLREAMFLPDEIEAFSKYFQHFVIEPRRMVLDAIYEQARKDDRLLLSELRDILNWSETTEDENAIGEEAIPQDYPEAPKDLGRRT